MKEAPTTPSPEGLIPQSCGPIKGTLGALAHNAKTERACLLFDAALLICCAALFYANSLVVIKWLAEMFPESIAAYVAQCHLNDLLGGLAFMCYANILISLVKPEVRFKTLKATIIFMTLCGIFWEYVAPLFIVASTSDPFDILAYVLGATLYWYLSTTFARAANKSLHVVSMQD